MSRIGRKPIAIPAGVTVTVDGNNVTVTGPKGTLNSTVSPLMTVAVEGATVVVSRPDDEAKSRSLHGLTRTLIANMVEGVTNGFTKELEVLGVGYRVAKQGKDLVMNLGYSHQVIMSENDDIKIEVPDPNKIKIIGIDKQKVGQFAAEVREKRPPEPYKGKGIRYVGEYVIRKEGKTGKGK
ncbi:MAG: 50S ribosomal protein L6 [Oscillospiraceae bacterium]|nr:50S ribosomal protein L6 [Oscillospiraceae bacterium]MBP1572109.1 50S ribosomal protein L6 [Oscillospiraceae bacterium]MBQ5313729.1 50S ribosomal protein L6 [Oscillospiraceae bacterium]